MPAACASCSRKANRSGGRFCHRCGRERQTGRRAWPRNIPYNADAIQNTVYKAVGYRAIGMVIAFVAVGILVFWIAIGRRAGEDVGMAFVAAVAISVIFFVKAGRDLELARAMQRRVKAQSDSRPRNTTL